jgi:hypothetical protein
VPWPVFLHGGPGIEALVGGRLWVLRLLLGLPAGVEVGLQGLVETVANGLELDLDDWLPRALAAAFLDPLVALGVADIRPRPLTLGPASASAPAPPPSSAPPWSPLERRSRSPPPRPTDHPTRYLPAAPGLTG